MASLTSQVGVGGGGATLLALVASQVDVHSTTTETNLLSFTVPADSLSTGNLIKIELGLSDYDVATANGVTFRLKYGSTTVASFIFDDSGTLTNCNGILHAYLYGGGATNSQIGSIYVAVDSNDDGAESFSMFDPGTAAEDSTGDLTLSVTAQPESSATTVGVTCDTGYAVLIPVAA